MADKYCSQCGELLVPGAKYCPGCGREVGHGQSANADTWNVIPAAPTVNQYTPSGAQVQSPAEIPVLQPMSKKQFRKVCTNEKYRKELKTSVITLYILTVINALVAVAVNPVGLVDAAINLGLTLGVHRGKSKACAVGILCYAIFCTLVKMVNGGGFTGWLWFIAAWGAIKAFKQADKEYDMIYVF